MKGGQKALLHTCGTWAQHAPSSPRELEKTSVVFRSFYSDRGAWSITCAPNQTKALTSMSSAKDPAAAAGIVSDTAHLEGKARAQPELRPGSLTFESGYLSRRCLGQAFLTSICGQGQGHPTAAQEKPNLLAACILQKTKQQQWRRSAGGRGASATPQLPARSAVWVRFFHPS